MNSIEDFFVGGVTSYDNTILRGTGKDLVLYLKEALECHETRRRRAMGLD
jgi:hypothetical protein